MRSALKSVAKAIALAAMLPCAALTFFGRLEGPYIFLAQFAALFPGIPGDYLRAAYYFMTLRSCSLDTRIAFGTYFSKATSSVGSHVSIGAFCVIGRAQIGSRTQFGPAVQVLSGARQHVRDAEGRLADGEFAEISIGTDCWIGASAVVMADVGSGSTVAAGAIVTSPVPPGTVVAGNPARILQTAQTRPKAGWRGKSDA